MRAQLRTYHAIPSLQAHQDPHAYKQLQDAPRLKSILKGGAEDRDEPSSLDAIKAQDVPRTNPVNLIFIMCNSALKVAELHFPKGHEFHDLIMKMRYSSASRARAFLWLMWFYLESDFTEEGCEENPFGAGVDYDLGVANQGIPELEVMTREEQMRENIDPEEEIEFGREKQKTRAKILEMDQAYLNDRENRRVKRMPFADDGPAILPRIRPSKHESDMDSTRSTPPPKGRIDRASVLNPSRRAAPLKYQIFEGSSPARQGPEGMPARKPRPPTAHQLAVERNRHERVEYILEHGLRRQHHKSRKLRRQHGAIYRAYRRVTAEDDPLQDSDSDSVPRENTFVSATQPFRERGIGGLRALGEQDDDFGEEVYTYAAALRRATRRLARWHGRDAKLGVVAPTKRPKPIDNTAEENKVAGEDDGGSTSLRLRLNGTSNGDVTMGDVTMDDVELDEVDQTALADDEARLDEDMDDPDRTEVMGESDMD
jgi:Ino eighty subunit 1